MDPQKEVNRIDSQKRSTEKILKKRCTECTLYSTLSTLYLKALWVQKNKNNYRFIFICQVFVVLTLALLNTSQSQSLEDDIFITKQSLENEFTTIRRQSLEEEITTRKSEMKLKIISNNQSKYYRFCKKEVFYA